MADRQTLGSMSVSTSTLRRRIIRIALSGIFAAAVLVGVTTGIPAFLRLADAQHVELVHSAQLTAQSIHEFLERAKVVADLGANQFQARQFLIMYNKGNIDADTVNASTSALLSGVVTERRNILGLVRLGLEQRAAASIGRNVPKRDWPAAAFSSDETQIGRLREMAGQAYFTVSAPILDPQYGRIGTDVMMVDATTLLNLLRPPEAVSGQETFLGVPGENALKFFSPAGVVSPDRFEEFTLEVAGSKDFVRLGDWEIGLAPVNLNGWLVLATTNYGRYFVHVWGDIAKVLLLALVVTGAVGIAIYTVMTPLAEGLVVRSETLEAEVAQRTQELNESEERFRGFAEAASDWFWETDADHRFTYLSDAFDSASGRLVSERVLGKTRWEIPNAIPEQGDWSDHIAQMDKRQPVVDFGYEIISRDGKKRTLRISGRPTYSDDGEFIGYRGVGRNITELRRAQREQERAERLFLASIASVPVAIALFDPDDRILVWNRLYAGEITKDVKLVAGMTFEEIVRLAVARGRVSEAEGNAEQWLERRLQQHRDPKGVFEVNLDAATLEIREHRTPDGYTIFIAHDVTRVKQADADLREQKELLQTILEHIPHAVYWKDYDLIYRGANRRFAETSGFATSDEVVGKTIYDILRNREEADAATAKDRSVLERKESKLNFEDSRTLEDGSVRTHLSSKVPLMSPDGEVTGILGIFTDITERKRMEQRLEESEARIRALFDGVSVGIAVVDADSQIILEANPVAAEMVGLPSDQIVGEVRDKFICSVETGKQPLSDTGDDIDSSEHWLYRADGSRVPILKTVRRLSLDGRECLLESFLDISEIKRAQEIVRKAQKLESLGNLAAGLAHELNNLLLPIGVLSAMTLRKLPDDSPERSKIEKIKEAADRAAIIIDQVTKFGAVDQAETELIDLRNVIAGALDLMRSDLPPTIKVERCLASDVMRIKANSGQISALVSNVVKNAADAMNGKPGDLRITLSRISLDRPTLVGATELPVGRYARLEVTDTGCGMEAETIERAFDPFFTTKEVGEGTGLGLSMVHGIVERQGGAVEISSETGKGTTVTVYLPVITEDIEEAADLAVSEG